MRTKMTNNPHEEIDSQAIADAVVELTAPDGKVYRFRYGAVLPYAGQEYVVLVELENNENDEEQLLITRLSNSPEGELSFEVVTEDDIIQAVFQKYMTESVRGSLDFEDGCCGSCRCDDQGDGCSCGHDHDHQSTGGCGGACGCNH